MKQYTVDHQNYRIFKVEENSQTPFVHFQWGKFDFRISYATAGQPDSSKKVFTNANGSQLILGKFEVLNKENWFEFMKPTAHGMQLEETLWRREGKDYYVEFPKDIKSIAEFLGSEELSFTSNNAVVA